MPVVELALPYPPSVNRIWRVARKGVYRSREYTDWLMEAGLKARVQRPGKISGPYHLSLHAVRPDRRRRDLDNLFKVVSDLLVSIGVVNDDCECEMLSARWVTTGDGVTVRISPAGGE